MKSTDQQNFTKYLFIGLFLAMAPYLLCLVLGYTFAPIDALHSLIVPYRDFKTQHPQTYFWLDTTGLFWPRYATLSRHELPISFVMNGGMPVYADTVSGFFSPIAAVTFGLFSASTDTLTVFWALQFLIYFFGICLWLKALQVSPVSILVVALTQVYTTAFLAGTYLAFQSLGALCFLPWALWAHQKFKDRPCRYWTVPIFLALSILGGNLQTGLYPIIAYVFWVWIQGEYKFGFYVVATAVCATLPMWLTGVEYHVIQNLSSISERQSEVPRSLLTKLLAVTALPAVIFPEAFGSSKSIDFLKILKTSGTYFIGSIGFIAPIVIFSSSIKSFFKRKESRFALYLIGFAVFVMLTPLVKFLYYRVLCLLCLGLSLLAAFAIEEIDEKKLKKLGSLLGFFLTVLCILIALVKYQYGFALTELFIEKLKASHNFGIVREWQMVRVQRWFETYFWGWRFFSILGLVFLLPIFATFNAENRKKALAFAIIIDCILLWYAQVVINKKHEPIHSAYNDLHQELKESPDYPLSRFLVYNCEPGPDLFHLATNEFQGVPAGTYYGSTSVQGINEWTPNVHCDSKTKRVSFKDSQALSSIYKGGFNVLVLNKDWVPEGNEFQKRAVGSEYSFWSRKDIASQSHALWGEGASGQEVFAHSKVTSWNTWGLKFSTQWDSEIESWNISIPYYPGWKYKVDGEIVKPDQIGRGAVPLFKYKLKPGQHIIELEFFPRIVFIGLLGSFFSILVMAWFSLRRTYVERQKNQRHFANV